MMQLTRISLFLLLPIVMPLTGLAEDGSVAINQACALDGGCFDGDSGGFPVTIADSGHYVLTSNIDVNVTADPPGTLAISVGASDVSIDLNGFAILGPASCTGTPVTNCDNGGSGSGIVASSGTSGLVVRNGTIRGMGLYGLRARDEAVVTDVRVIGNADVGLRTEGQSRIDNVIAQGNGQNGVSAGEEALIVDSQAIGNGNVGFNVLDSSLIRDSAAISNGSVGYFIRGQSSAIDNLARLNSSSGIACFTQAAVRGNVLADNGNVLDTDCVQVADNVCNGSPC